MGKIIIAGGTGHLGTLLADSLRRESNKLYILTRRIPGQGNPEATYVLWDGKSTGTWKEILEGADVVINLCGKSVNCRYTPSNKEELISSRVESTRALGNAIRETANPPILWINASSAAYYGFSEEIMDEMSPAGNDFPAEICQKWEEAFDSYKLEHTRKVALRTGVVLQRKKGLILPFMRLVYTFMGGRQGSGRQYFTWIHEDDFLESIHWIIQHTNAHGAYNITSPQPVRNEEFMASLREAMGIFFGFPSPAWLVHFGAGLIGTEPDLVLKGRYIKPARLLQEGFEFRHPEIRMALKHLLKNDYKR